MTGRMPEGWNVAPLGELVTFAGGGTPSKSNPLYYVGTIPWVSPKDMKSWDIVDSQDHINQLALDNSAAKLISPGSVLIVVRSGVLKHTLPIAINRVPVALNQDMKALLTKGQLLPDYLAYYLLSSSHSILQSVRGTTADNIPLDTFEKLPVRYPPLPEQRRIAELLDRADALRRKRKEALQLTEDLLRSVFLEMFGDPVTNPKGWEVRALGEHFAAAPQNGTVEPATPDGLYPVVRVGELGSDLVDIAECGQVNLPQGDVVKYRCQAGDFLLARAIGSESHLGKASMVPSSSVPIVYDSHVMRLRFNKDKIIPLFFLIWLRIPGGRQLFMAKARRTAVQWNINAEQIAAIQMPTPPIQMQRKFVTQCDLIQRELAQHARSSQDLDSLFSSLLHQAFSGAL